MARLIQPPAPLVISPEEKVIFLAGSIEMGQAENWQADLCQRLDALDCVILNPRRPDWDNTWEQSIHHQRFREQVEWELAGMELADVIAVYFAPQTKAAVSMLEFGLHAKSGKVVVCCPDGFWRKGNVEIVCARFAVPLVNSIDELATRLWPRLQ